jgi:urease accessory protein
MTTITPATPTRTEAAHADASVRPAAARVHATAGRHGATILADLRPAAPWAPRPLPPAGRTARVALVQTTATLCAGDAVALDVTVAAGAALELVETGATVAHDARGGPPARVRIHVRLGAGARLTWLARPLVLAAGCAVERTTDVTLAAGARALLRETVVLGRSGEQPGALSASTRATLAGRPLLHERLDTRDPALLRSPVVAGDAATVDAIALLGQRAPDLPGTSQLHGTGTIWRALSSRATDPDAAAGPVIAAWTTDQS